MDKLLLRPEEACEVLGLGRTKVYEMIARSEIPVVRIGRSVRVPRSALVEWLDEKTLHPAAVNKGS